MKSQGGERMKVLGIYGSPRKGGNTDQLLDRVLEGAQSAGAEVKKVYVRDLILCAASSAADATKPENAW